MALAAVLVAMTAAAQEAPEGGAEGRAARAAELDAVIRDIAVSEGRLAELRREIDALDEWRGGRGWFAGKPVPAVMADLQSIYPKLKIIDNNSRTSVGGGGTPRQPLAPPFAGGESAAASRARATSSG